MIRENAKILVLLITYKTKKLKHVLQTAHLDIISKRFKKNVFSNAIGNLNKIMLMDME